MTDHATQGSGRPRRSPGGRWAALPALVLTAATLAGCMLSAERPVVLAEPDAPPTAAASPTRVKTVKAAAGPGGEEAAPSVAGVPVAAMPTPRQIFDFHPAGASPDAWRQPFVIDPNDGPLSAEVRKTAAELKSFLAETKAGAKPLASRRCGETDVATARPGCPAPAAARIVPKP